MKVIWKFFSEQITRLFGEERAKKIIDFTKKAWNGDVSLWNVFWVYGLAVPIVLSVLVVTPLSAVGGRLGMSLALLAIAPYAVWMLKSIWACSTNLEEEQYHGVEKIYITYIAKAFVVMGSLQYFLALFG